MFLFLNKSRIEIDIFYMDLVGQSRTNLDIIMKVGTLNLSDLIRFEEQIVKGVTVDIIEQVPIIKTHMSRTEFMRLIDLGVLAPSADNLQPWKFKILDAQMDLYLDSKFTQNFCDENLLAPYLSAGAVIENLRVAASELAHNLLVSYFPDANDSKFVASLRLKHSGSNKHPHLTVIKKRLTNRKFYSSKIIDSSIYENLRRLVQTESEFDLIWIQKTDPRYKRLCQLLGEADQLRFENKRLHEEFMQTMRFNKHDREQTRDGLDIRTLEAGPGSIFLFKLISSWKRLKCMNKLGMSRIFNAYTHFQLQTSQACGLIISKKHAPINYVLGGETMEKLWHEVTLQNLALQPMEALPIFLIHLKEMGCHEFDQEQQTKLKKLKETFYSLFPIQESNGLIFLFRIGYSRQPRIRSMRRDAESFLVK